jgi:cell division protein ZapA (FtsZ GTPase activity inhibitor)
MTTTTAIEVTIAGQPYRLAVKPEFQATLQQAAARVDAEMNRIRQGSKVRAHEHIAVMAALSLASDLLETQREQAKLPQVVAANAALDRARLQLGNLANRTEQAIQRLQVKPRKA